MAKLHRAIRKPVIAVVGGVVLVAGIIMIPYPGPGWLVVFAGLAILATEFKWAKDVLDKAKGLYDAWQQWLKRQSFAVQALFFILTGLVVLATLWLLNVFGLLGSFLHLNFSWLKSPLFG